LALLKWPPTWTILTGAQKISLIFEASASLRTDTDRVFSDEVFAADLSDIEFASAFSLRSRYAEHRDAGPICNLNRVVLTGASQSLQNPPWDDLEGRATAQFHDQIFGIPKGAQPWFVISRASNNGQEARVSSPYQI